MKTVKIIHTADLHLDCKFQGLPLEESKIRRQELKDSFVNALDMYSDAQVVLIAGDIFDGSNFLKSTIVFLKDTFSKYPDTTFFISLGNHDCYNSPQGEALRDNMPQNVVIFSDKAEYMELDDLGVRVYGMSFSDKHQHLPLMSQFEVIDDDYINILLLHGDIVSNGGESNYNPVYTEEIAKSGFDYIALGHIHNSTGINLADRTYYAYSGTHEPHGFDECGKKGIIYGVIGKGMCRLSVKDTAIRQYNEINIDVSDCLTIENIYDLIKSHIESEKNLYKINLSGILRENIDLDTKLMEKMLNTFYIKISDDTRKNYNLDALSMESGIKGFVARAVLTDLSKCGDDDVDIVCGASDYLFEIIDNGGKR